MKANTALAITVIFLIGLALTGLNWIQAAEPESTVNIEISEDKTIPEKPGGIPHELDGPYTQCSSCHQLEIPPHPAKVENCLICHTQKVEEDKARQ
jgi:hypothetical protein